MEYTYFLILRTVFNYNALTVSASTSLVLQVKRWLTQLLLLAATQIRRRLQECVARLKHLTFPDLGWLRLVHCYEQFYSCDSMWHLFATSKIFC